jgi:hypothetical protein
MGVTTPYAEQRETRRHRQGTGRDHQTQRAERTQDSTKTGLGSAYWNGRARRCLR